jgi:UDP-galactopyranose mutase
MPIENPENAEEMVLSLVGKDLYEKFYKNYTIKQWGIHPKDLDASVTKRIPIRYSDESSYFNDRFQAMPKAGYSNLISNMLDNKLILMELGADFNEIKQKIKYKTLIYTGPIDEYYDYRFGELGYRSLKFEHLSLESKFYQECQQVNYPNDNDFTRIIEWKHATKSESEKTSIMREFPIEYQRGGERFYPVPTAKNRAIYRKYAELANEEKNLFFIGRLAEYRYYNMDQVVENALKLFNAKLNYLK